MMQSRLEVAMALRKVDRPTLLDRISVEKPSGNVVSLYSPMTRERLRDLIDGPVLPTEAEARRLGVVLDFPPDFFRLDPVPVMDLLHEHKCECGNPAVVACDLCDKPFCHKHAPPEGPADFHDCGCWRAPK